MKEPRPIKTPKERNVFVMMRYRDHDKALGLLEQTIRRTLRSAGLHAIFAKDVHAERDLWRNVKYAMDHCSYGIAVYDKAWEQQDVVNGNPNVCIELGYLLAQEQECLILHDKSLALPVNIRSFLAGPYDGTHIQASVGSVLRQWIEHKVVLFPRLNLLTEVLPESKVSVRLNESAVEKLAIGKEMTRLVQNSEGPAETLLLDSGTTAAIFAEAFSEHYKGPELTVHTNNVLAAMLLCGTPQVCCHLFPGKVDDEFGGVFGAGTIEAIRSLKADIGIIACTGFTMDSGPYANSPDNVEVKRAIMASSRKLFMLIPSDRFGKGVGTPILPDNKKWAQVLRSKIDGLLTHMPADDPKTMEKQRQLHGKLIPVQF